jgi:nucleotide-binding universal stress UspA family protein
MDEQTVRERFADEVAEATAEFDSACAELDPSSRVRRTLKLQDARQALVEAAASADLVVLGARGRGRVGAMLLGSVSNWMLHGVSHPTVIVPEPRD